MKVIYVTAAMPYGDAEAFIADEISELLRRHDILIVPRSPGRLGPHASYLGKHTRCEKLLSLRVLRDACELFLRNPGSVASACRPLLRSGSLKRLLANLVVLPKALWLARLAASWKAGHIHCHWAGTTATMTMIAGEISGIPWTLTAHRSDIVGNNLLSQKARSAAFVRAICEDGRRMLIARGADAGDKLRVLAMGVRIPPLTSAKRPRTAVVFCPADLLEVKGHQYLIRAWKILRDRKISGELWLAGRGNRETCLRQLVSELGLRESVLFLGTIDHQSLLRLYENRRVSVVVLASVDLGNGCHEGLPVALVEAMSYAVPVVATNTGGIPELIQPGTGILVPPEDPVALATAIQRVLQDEGSSEKMGHAGRCHVIETRDVTRVAAELERCWTDLAEKHSQDSFAMAAANCKD